jgi:mannose-1-phosphate guanylyltransferase
VVANVWSIVLAAGAGRRLASLTGGVPKQFWRPGGGASLLETTLGRLAPLSDPQHTVIVVDQSHRQHVASMAPDRAYRFLLQPSDRGTATGVLLALMPVLDADPEAVVLLTPADHGVRHEDRFRDGVIRAVRQVRDAGGIVLFGVPARHASDDYGWIVPAAGRPAANFRPVGEFVEKPPSIQAGRLMESGGVWNTMVVVTRAATLCALFREHLGELARVFEDARRLPPHERDAFLSGVYPTLGFWDLSRDLLAASRNLLVYTWPTTIGWTDLGTPERLRGWFRRPAKVLSQQTVDAA